MPILTAQHLRCCLCVLLLLTGCGLAKKPLVVSRPSVIKVAMPTFRTIPESLTTLLSEPPAPPLLCILNDQAVPCLIDVLATIPAYQATLRLCNADRQRTALLGRTGALYGQ